MQIYLTLVRDRLWSTLDALLPVRDFDREARVALAARREPVFREMVSSASPWAGRRRSSGRRGQTHSEAA
jgi:hypothetical protein